MQLAAESGVLKSDPHKSQSLNHFHVPHSPRSAKRPEMSKQDISFFNRPLKVDSDLSFSQMHKFP